MIIEISDVFLTNTDYESPINLEIDKPKTIGEIIEDLGIESLKYGTYFLNDTMVEEDEMATDNDKITIVPIFGGG